MSKYAGFSALSPILNSYCPFAFERHASNPVRSNPTSSGAAGLNKSCTSDTFKYYLGPDVGASGDFFFKVFKFALVAVINI
jgi:hypothetical protein